MAFSIIHYYGKQESRCGYCKGTKCSMAHGMHAYSMTPQDYQDLIDRGWRRSGHYCYKPHNKTTCCPCYTIKCDVLDFKPSKSHKKILKRMNRFLRDGKKDKNEEHLEAAETAQQQHTTDEFSGGGVRDEPKEPDVALPEVNLAAVAAANPTRYAAAELNNEHFDDKQQTEQPANAQEVSASLPSSAGSLDSAKKSLDGPRPPCKKAKQMRLERREAKLSKLSAEGAACVAAKPPALAEKTLQDFFATASESDKHKLKLLYVQAESKQFYATLRNSYALYQKYQTRIHNDPPSNVEDYLDFLQRSPLKHTKTHDGPATGYGSFHQQYWLDDKLIAVGVMDILPHCVSSVYFFYDPDYSFLSLGTYGSLREIAYVQQLAAKVPALKYYYMGFYIHSCPKMRYKGKLVPSYLLCPEVYTWHLLTDATRDKLNEHKYQRQNPDRKAADAADFTDRDLDPVLLLVEKNVINYRQYIQITGDDDDRADILEYGKLVGKACAHRMLYIKA